MPALCPQEDGKLGYLFIFSSTSRMVLHILLTQPISVVILVAKGYYRQALGKGFPASTLNPGFFFLVSFFTCSEPSEAFKREAHLQGLEEVVHG